MPIENIQYEMQAGGSQPCSCHFCGESFSSSKRKCPEKCNPECTGQ